MTTLPCRPLRHFGIFGLGSAVLFGAVSLMAQESLPVPAVPQVSAPATADATAAARPQEAGTKRALIICGHPGDDEYREIFAETVTKLSRGLTATVGVPADQITLFFGVDAETDAKQELPVPTAGPATREAITARIEALRGELQPEDSLWVIVVGHASFEGRRSWINLPGPDLHQDEFAKLFREVACREQVFVMALPASGYYLKALAKPGRCVVTATEADLEINATEFGQALADALLPTAEQPMPDVDQDGALTLFDLYVAATRGVAQRYLAETLVMTEHALLDDNGDGRGTELQRSYLTEAEGGERGTGRRRSRKKADLPPSTDANRDGVLAAKIKLAIVPAPAKAIPAAPTQTPPP